MHEYTALENFWKRYNKALLDKLALDREKQTLEDENSKLKALLKQYLDGELMRCPRLIITNFVFLPLGISVNDEILSQSNPLFVINHKTNASPRYMYFVNSFVPKLRVLVTLPLMVKNFSLEYEELC